MPVRPCKKPDMYYTLMLSQSPRPALTCVSSPRAFPARWLSDTEASTRSLHAPSTPRAIAINFSGESRSCWDVWSRIADSAR